MTDDGRTAILEVRTSIAARPETVFRYFTDPERFSLWMGAGQGRASLEPRVGGALRVEYDGHGPSVAGEVLALDPPARFAFSWGFVQDDGLPAGASRVEVTLTPTAEGTLVVLRHSGLPTESSRRAHGGGWRVYLSVLASRAADEQHLPSLSASVAAWFAAWAEEDAEKRRALLESCCVADVDFRDAWAAVTGIPDLGAHVAASRAVSRGVSLEHAGDLTPCHDHVRFGWRAVGRDGSTLLTGCNVALVDLDGRFRRVLGFRDDGPVDP